MHDRQMKMCETTLVLETTLQQKKGRYKRSSKNAIL